jgi:hypothetical protein
VTSRRITFRRGRIRWHFWQRDQSGSYSLAGFEKDCSTLWKCDYCDRRDVTYDGEPPRGKYLPKCRLIF